MQFFDNRKLQNYNKIRFATFKKKHIQNESLTSRFEDEKKSII